MLPEQGMRLGIVAETLREERCDGDALWRQRAVHRLEQPAEVGLSRTQRQSAAFLAKVDERSRALRSRVQQQLHHLEREIYDGSVG